MKTFLQNFVLCHEISYGYHWIGIDYWFRICHMLRGIHSIDTVCIHLDKKREKKIYGNIGNFKLIGLAQTKKKLSSFFGHAYKLDRNFVEIGENLIHWRT